MSLNSVVNKMYKLLNQLGLVKPEVKYVYPEEYGFPINPGDRFEMRGLYIINETSMKWFICQKIPSKNRED